MFLKFNKFILRFTEVNILNFSVLILILIFWIVLHILLDLSFSMSAPFTICVVIADILYLILLLNKRKKDH
ncbi:hypothetical protein PMSD_01775 [Paenibacillus macquariensis subsp. defensor]|nr:hypothetical protein PMSD_01775 [Paenibacillus macquariensis subsp. defensor]